MDVSRESSANLALAVDVMVETAPSAAVTLGMECGEGCSGALNVSETITALPVGEWTSLRVGLRCFEEAGADMTRIDTPFLLATTGELALSFSEVKLVSAAEGEAACP